jgi:hypothetical protein
MVATDVTFNINGGNEVYKKRSSPGRHLVGELIVFDGADADLISWRGAAQLRGWSDSDSDSALELDLVSGRQCKSVCLEKKVNFILTQKTIYRVSADDFLPAIPFYYTEVSGFGMEGNLGWTMPGDRYLYT